MKKETTISFCRILAMLTLGVGAAGSILCLPFALGTDLKLMTIAGIYLIAGAIMITGGLLTYAILIKTE